MTGTARRSLTALWTAVLATVIATFATTTFLLLTAYDAYTIPSASMRPTLQVGTKVLSDPKAEPQLGDLVVYSAPGRGAGSQIGRVIGVGGQTVACCTDGALTRDGVRLSEPYVDGNVPARSFSPVTVPAGRLWLMRDDRADAVGDLTVAEDDVLGVVVSHGSAEALFGYVLARGAVVGLPLGALVLALGLALRSRRRTAPSQAAAVETLEEPHDWDVAWEHEGLDLLLPEKTATPED